MNRQAAADAKLPEPGPELDELAKVVVDASLEVHRVLGPGFLESVYEEALSVELGLRGAACRRQVPVELTYKQFSVGHARLDLLVSGRLVVELKAAESQLPIHTAQLLSYLKTSPAPEADPLENRPFGFLPIKIAPVRWSAPEPGPEPLNTAVVPQLNSPFTPYTEPNVLTFGDRWSMGYTDAARAAMNGYPASPVQR